MDLENKGKDKTTAESDLVTTKSDLDATQKELDAALAYYEKLKPSCVDAGLSYEERVKMREEEIQSLQEALFLPLRKQKKKHTHTHTAEI